MDKPLFIPLMGEYYDAFLAGTKKFELRLYGDRWNIKTCRIGRQVILSRGYGKQNRATGTIKAYSLWRVAQLSPDVVARLERLYGKKVQPYTEFIAIYITDIKKIEDTNAN